ncbi:hypothetical protein [Natronococcus jeotgali]|uniref:Uncharacterized protein n=1 Tax=Natronococcus jeotgali DSM 18795 TaxID=1227498 RepID=L9XAX9_9EURY|nr:hypothetical protein [Natronococcus jeotgali]ELY58566.1 hypothetical protein C492_12145 [Natronococcus jeotgali DSM 18795]
MSVQHDPLEFDRENARLAATGLAAWLTLTVLAIVLLLQFGPAISGLFV